MAPSMHHLAAMLQDKIREGPEAVPGPVMFGLMWLAIMFVLVQVFLTYTHGSLVSTLAMVEDTSPTALVAEVTPPAYSDDPSAKPSEAPPAYTEANVLLVNAQPLTASNRATIRHLYRMVGSKRVCFRGMGIALLHGLLTHWIANFVFYLLGGGKAGAALGFMASQLMLYRLNMLWTHIVISRPSPKRFWQRVVPRATAKKALLPTFLWAATHLALSAMLVAVTQVLHFEHRAEGNRHHHCQQGVKALFLALVTVASLVFVYLPVNVALTRYQASLLNDDEEPIIPFDRSFGGLTTREGHRWRFNEAWTSFDWNGRIRLVKVYVRTILYMVLSTLFFAAAGAITVSAWVMWTQ